MSGTATTGLRVAAVVAAALLVGAMVVRLSATLATGSPAAREAVGEGTDLQLGAEDDTPLFVEEVLVPGRATTACHVVDIGSTDDPDPIGVRVAGWRGSAALAEALVVTVEHGNAEGTCASFRPEATVVQATLADLTRDHGPEDPALPGPDPQAGHSQVWFRITMALPDTAPSTLAGTRVEDLALRWDASVAVVADRPLATQLSLLFGAVAQRSTLPLTLLIVLGTLFLGIQDRIDRRDPKLAIAPVTPGAVTFTARGDL